MERGEAHRILVVDDSPTTVEVLQRNLEAAGYRVLTAGSVAEALEALQVEVVDLVITDVKMPRVSGLDLVRHVRDNYKDTEVTVITGYPNVDGAVSALKHGAADYLTKPFTDAELLAAVREALDKVERRRLAGPAPAPLRAPQGLLGQSPAMRVVLEKIERAARTRATVLISGESGTGKELVARAIHYGGDRASAPFVPVNCGAIPHELLESELFGHVKGSFTGADDSRAGFFLTADRGTIFLDEVAETSPAMQVKLLRVLQEGEVHMVGASRPRKVDVRVIAATNKDLGQLVAKGIFREDFYFRINVIALEVPPLRSRVEDIPLLANHFARKFAAELGQPTTTFSDRAMRVLEGHSWPGNVRELENLVQRLVVMVDRELVDVADLPSFMRFSAAAEEPGLGRTLAEVEARYVQRVLDSVGGNKTRAAQILGIDRKTLRARLVTAQGSGAGGPRDGGPSEEEPPESGEDGA